MTRPTILAEPLLHFFVAGAALFAIFASVDRGVETPSESAGTPRIIVGPKEIQPIKLRWQNQWGREPAKPQFTKLVNDFIREETLYRQAVAMGLDRDDTIVRRRMAQKMTFLIEGVAIESSPSDSTLQTWFVRSGSLVLRPFLLPATASQLCTISELS